jgi:hypothetical protein
VIPDAAAGSSEVWFPLSAGAVFAGATFVLKAIRRQSRRPWVTSRLA